jgi:hypothetical protein
MVCTIGVLIIPQFTSLLMYIPKRYGESRIEACPFCGASAYTKNKQGIPVCADHKHTELNDLKCMCGSWLDMREGKFGMFFICEKCGTRNMRQALEMNPQIGKTISKPSTSQFAKPASSQREQRSNAYKDENGRDIYIRSDDPRFGFR